MACQEGPIRPEQQRFADAGVILSGARQREKVLTQNHLRHADASKIEGHATSESVEDAKMLAHRKATDDIPPEQWRKKEGVDSNAKRAQQGWQVHKRKKDRKDKSRPGPCGSTQAAMYARHCVFRGEARGEEADADCRAVQCHPR